MKLATTTKQKTEDCCIIIAQLSGSHQMRMNETYVKYVYEATTERSNQIQKQSDSIATIFGETCIDQKRKIKKLRLYIITTTS